MIVVALVYLIQRILNNSRDRVFLANPLRGIEATKEGGRQFITGKAHSPVPLIAPISKAGCVFYLEQVRMVMSPKHFTGRGRYPEADLAPNAYGVFFIRKGGRAALVAPVAKSVHLTKPENKRLDIPLLGGYVGDINRTEHIIVENEAVTVLGIPRPFNEFMRYLRTSAQFNMPQEMVKELVKMEGDPATGDMPCYFGSGVELVTDQTYEDYIARTASTIASQTAYIISAIFLAAGAGILWYVLMLGTQQ